MDCFDNLDNQGDRGIFPGMEILHSQPQLSTTLLCKPALKSFKVNLVIKLLVHNRPFIMGCEMKCKLSLFVAKNQTVYYFWEGKESQLVNSYAHIWTLSKQPLPPITPPPPKWFKISKFRQKNTSKVFLLGSPPLENDQIQE